MKKLSTEQLQEYQKNHRKMPRGNSAVLIPLLPNAEDATGWSVLFEVRSPRIGQGGEVCFPGGRMECGEDGGSAAVRETTEELLIAPETVELVAPVVELPGPGGIRVKAYAGILHDYQMTYSKDEVQRMFTVPLSWFVENPPQGYDAPYEINLPEEFPFEDVPGGRDYPFHKIPNMLWFYHTPEGIIWGLTAKILREFVEIVGELV